MNMHTIVTTAEGRVVAFSGVVSKWAVVHPKAAIVIAFVAGLVVRSLA